MKGDSPPSTERRLQITKRLNQVDEDESACEWDPMIVMGRKTFVPDQKITQVCLVILVFVLYIR